MIKKKNFGLHGLYKKYFSVVVVNVGVKVIPLTDQRLAHAQLMEVFMLNVSTSNNQDLQI